MRAWLLLWLLAAVTGCGFQPVVPAAIPFQSLYVTAPDYSSFGADLKRYVESYSKTQLAKTPQGAEAVLEILDERRATQILSLNSSGRVAEYMLHYQVTFRLRGKDKQELIPPSTITLQQDLQYDDDIALAKENEQAFLYNSMRNQAIQEVLSRVAAVPIGT